MSRAPLQRTLTHRLHTLHKLSDRVSQAAYLADARMSMSEGRCLAAIGAFEPLSIRDLAQHANLDKGQASRAAQALVDAGLARKTADVQDGRGVQLTLTARGRTRWQRVMALIERRNAEIFGCLNADERRLFGDALDRLIEQARSQLP
ncbi:MarR family winged helix-turn-helix transcriptional regulator [Rhizobacter sp. Root404]|jgi:DNA-binding MarR family transcriptional regulator|uniref:MarR family winged helix-turn-helix transcriptional regulator n=1 Tax=Rhizobacter sp. Root404 TaxID=1736528 RepID=UPI0006FAF7C2|nr:MarR family transcriptional regulator [Rhizobacter sp. Root404]KQW36475.1 MarR family transcriptional regulator [Rhizobacter sp. Root404]